MQVAFIHLLKAVRLDLGAEEYINMLPAAILAMANIVHCQQGSTEGLNLACSAITTLVQILTDFLISPSFQCSLQRYPEGNNFIQGVLSGLFQVGGTTLITPFSPSPTDDLYTAHPSRYWLALRFSVVH